MNLTTRFGKATKSRVRACLGPTARWLRYFPRCQLNRWLRLGELLNQCDGRVHLGCGGRRLPGFLNVDALPGPAVDILSDCSSLRLFNDRSLSVLFSNAFFEHLHDGERRQLLSDAMRTLRPQGRLFFAGIPDFEGVALAYLERRTPGNTRPVFDVHEVYRYTHGELDFGAAFQLEHLHKCPLDASYLKVLLREAGFESGFVFRYRWGEEPSPVSLGFLVGPREAQIGKKTLLGISLLREAKVNEASLEILASL